MKKIISKILRKYRAEMVLFALALIAIAGLITSKYYQVEEPVILPIVETPKIWGFPLDSISIDTMRVKPNQNLSEMLTHCGMNTFGIEKLVSNAVNIFDVRKIRAGNNYYLINKKDSPKTADVLIYEESPVNYVIFELSDSLKVYRGQKDIVTKMKSTSGTIESSLWNAMIKQGNDPMLAVSLSDIYAWTIDFFGIQKGDQYRVYYEELYVDDKMVGIGRIHAASFINSGDSISAFYFNNDGQEGFFDYKGQSLRKAFLKAPLNFSRISSKFSNNRMHPVLKIVRPHHGVDYAAPTGTPVYSIGDGVVVKKAYQAGGGGNYLTINHNSVYASQYMHLDKYASGISAGTKVKQGQLIGYVGRTGLASGPHLDFRIYKNGTPIDPLKIDAPPSEPINDKNMAQFISLRDSLKAKLYEKEESKTDLLATK